MQKQANKTRYDFRSTDNTPMLPKSPDGDFVNPSDNKQPTVAIYCRLSEEDRNKQSAAADSGSIQNQKALLSQYAHEQQWEIYHIYSDDDYAGADRNRPAFCQLLTDAQSGKFQIVLCKTQSRFTRELEVVEKYIHGLFPQWGIRFISVVDHADSANKSNKKARQINGLMNEWYLEDMSDNIKSVLTSRRKNGYHIGSFALYGYQKDPERKGGLRIDEQAAAVVRDVFSLFAQGYGKTAIAQILNERGIPNPTEYKRQKNLRYKAPKGKTGTRWKYFSVANILSNEMYIGNMVQGKYGSVSYKSKENRPRGKEQWITVKNTHAPLIDSEMWDRVQKLLQQRHKPFAIGKIGLFAKKAICAGCGYTMRSTKSHGRYYLKCGTKHVAKNACEGAFISVEALEKTVLRELRRLNGEYLDKDLLAKRIHFVDNETDEKEKIHAELRMVEEKVADYTKGIQEAYLDKAKGVITEEDFLAFTKAFTLDRQRMERLAEAAKDSLAKWSTGSTLSGEQRKMAWIDQITSLDRLDRLTVETMVECITVRRKKPDTKEIPIDIHWRF